MLQCLSVLLSLGSRPWGGGDGSLALQGGEHGGFCEHDRCAIVARSLRDRCTIVAPTYLAGLQLPRPHLPKIVPVHMAFAKLFSHLGDLVVVSYELSGV